MFDAIKPYFVEIVPTIVVLIAAAIVLRRVGRDKVAERLKGKGPLIAGMVIAGIAVMAVLQIGAARLTAPDVDDIIARDSVLPAILEAFPEQEAGVRDRLRRVEGRGEAAIRQEVVAIGHDLGAALMPRLVGTAPDDAVLGFLDAFAASMEEAADQGGAVCLTYLLGGADGGSMPEFSAEARDSISGAVMRIVAEGAGGKPKRFVDDATFSTLLTQIVDRAYVLAGDRPLDFVAYGDLGTIRDDETKQRVCWTALYFHLAIRELPPDQAASLYRTLIATQ